MEPPYLPGCLLVQECAELLVLGADMAHKQTHMSVELRKVSDACLAGHSGGYLPKGLLILFVESVVRFVSRIPALFLELLLMREMAVNVVVQELHGFAHLCASLSLAARVEKRVHRVQQLTVLVVYDTVARFQFLCKFVSHNVISSFRTGYVFPDTKMTALSDSLIK